MLTKDQQRLEKDNNKSTLRKYPHHLKVSTNVDRVDALGLKYVGDHRYSHIFGSELVNICSGNPKSVHAG